jgi:hypothetical protein
MLSFGFCGAIGVYGFFGKVVCTTASDYEGSPAIAIGRSALLLYYGATCSSVTKAHRDGYGVEETDNMTDQSNSIKRAQENDSQHGTTRDGEEESVVSNVILMCDTSLVDLLD